MLLETLNLEKKPVLIFTLDRDNAWAAWEIADIDGPTSPQGWTIDLGDLLSYENASPDYGTASDDVQIGFTETIDVASSQLSLQLHTPGNRGENEEFVDISFTVSGRALESEGRLELTQTDLAFDDNFALQVAPGRTRRDGLMPGQQFFITETIDADGRGGVLRARIPAVIDKSISVRVIATAKYGNGQATDSVTFAILKNPRAASAEIFPLYPCPAAQHAWSECLHAFHQEGQHTRLSWRPQEHNLLVETSGFRRQRRSQLPEIAAILAAVLGGQEHNTSGLSDTEFFPDNRRKFHRGAFGQDRLQSIGQRRFHSVSRGYGASGSGTRGKQPIRTFRPAAASAPGSAHRTVRRRRTEDCLHRSGKSGVRSIRRNCRSGSRCRRRFLDGTFRRNFHDQGLSGRQHTGGRTKRSGSGTGTRRRVRREPAGSRQGDTGRNPAGEIEHRSGRLPSLQGHHHLQAQNNVRFRASFRLVRRAGSRFLVQWEPKLLHSGSRYRGRRRGLCAGNPGIPAWERGDGYENLEDNGSGLSESAHPPH